MEVYIMKDVQISKKAMGQAVKCIIDHVTEMYCVMGYEAVEEMEQSFDVARMMCHMYELRETADVERAIVQMEKLFQNDGYNDFGFELHMC